jgi:hypothetical protein
MEYLHKITGCEEKKRTGQKSRKGFLFPLMVSLMRRLEVGPHGIKLKPCKDGEEEIYIVITEQKFS